MQTVEIGNTVPSPDPTSNNSSSTSAIGIDVGQIAKGASDRIESESPTNAIRL